MTKHVASLITDTGASIFVNGQLYSIPNDHPNFGRIADAVASGKTDLIESLVDLRTAVRQWLRTNRRFTLVGDQLSLDGIPFADAVTNKALAMIDAWKRYVLLGDLRRIVYGPPAFFGDAIWKNENAWCVDRAAIKELRLRAEASVGSIR